MNMSDLLQLGATIFRQSNLSGDAGSNLDLGSVVEALGSLSGDGGGLNLGSLMESMESGGLGSVLSSWLGDGANDSISPDQIGNVLGMEKIEEFSSQLGLSPEETMGGLSEALPQMVDRASSGGSLLDSIGGIEGAINLAGKLFK